ncbi:hypothetical protein PCANB_000815 [Pneumocystis canis]|nr:hypothetical protein PCANB_000815 [Pneumocystis canis]
MEIYLNGLVLQYHLMREENQKKENWETNFYIFQKEYSEIEEDFIRWNSHRKEYEKLRLFLINLSKTTRKTYMVPFSSKGFIPGTLIHTNEILVLLGENWFVERSSVQAIDIVNRRLEYVKNHLKKLHQQQKDLKIRLDHMMEMNESKIYNDEGLPIVEIREELNEDGSIANSEVLDRLMNPWITQASEELSKKLDASLKIFNEDYCEIFDENKNSEMLANSSQSQIISDTCVPSSSMGIPIQDSIETMINIVDEIDELEAETNVEHRSDNSNDSEETEDEFGRTRGFISPVCVATTPSKTSGCGKKVAFSESTKFSEGDCVDMQDKHSSTEHRKKTDFLIKDVIERPSIESTEQVLNDLSSSLHRREIATEYYRLKQKLHAENDNLDHSNFKQVYNKDQNTSKKKMSLFKASFMEKNI